MGVATGGIFERLVGEVRRVECPDAGRARGVEVTVDAEDRRDPGGFELTECIHEVGVLGLLGGSLWLEIEHDVPNDDLGAGRGELARQVGHDGARPGRVVVLDERRLIHADHDDVGIGLG